MNGLPLILMIAALDKTKQNTSFRDILPALIPGQTGRLLLATVKAREQARIREDQIKSQAEADEALVREMKTALRLERRDQLDPLKALKAAFNRLPASVQGDIFQSAPPPAGGTKSGGNG